MLSLLSMYVLGSCKLVGCSSFSFEGDLSVEGSFSPLQMPSVSDDSELEDDNDVSDGASKLNTLSLSLSVFSFDTSSSELELKSLSLLSDDSETSGRRTCKRVCVYTLW